jgi:DNA polymerase V
MTTGAEKMGRPPGEPTKVVRPPLSVAALARRLAANSLRAGDINAFINVEAQQVATTPLTTTSAECGFPSPADDYLDRPLLIENPAVGSRFGVRIRFERLQGLTPRQLN